MRVVAGIFVTIAAVLSLAAASGTMAADSPDIPEEQKTVHVVLYPAAEPRPALKYQLLPPFPERRPGNAAVWWNRLPAERSNFLSEFSKEYQESGKFVVWMEIPLGDPREKAYREKELSGVAYMIRGGGGIYSDMARAARFESCDWEQPVREGNFIATTLPEVQGSRMWARMLSAKAHLEIAEGRYDDAVQTLQIGYAEARHVSQSPFLVSGLVGVTIAGIMSHQVQQFIQRPDAPNLYWALSTLPRPVVSMRVGGEAESSFLYLQFPELRDLDKKKLSPDEWRELLTRTVASVIEFDDNRGSLLSRNPSAVLAMAAIQGYPRAKQYLTERGRTAAEVEAMPVAQVILLYTVQVYNELSDDQFKWFFLPADEGNRGLERAERRYSSGAIRAREIIPVASLLLPAIAAAKMAETRGEWTVAMLRVFEAMRLYGATHDGQWPDRLSDMTDVPIPVNPCDGKAFVYQREGNKATLTSEKGPRNVPWRYEVTLMPKAK
jgi:hypothetical protein